jgi:hypothetical protein
MSNKQSSVEYLIEHLLPKALTVEQYYHIEKAKAMHKEEIKDAYLIGFDDARSNMAYNDEYYKETFEQ